jgi:hypothetical protein
MYSRSNSAALESDLELAKTWLRQCLDNHQECHTWREKKAQLLPTRVIKVGSASDGKAPFLYETVPGEEGQYICLSHRWGGDKIITSTAVTLQDRKQGIRLEDMPRTFQDAIHITRELGFEYLWIDSLCILQDEDKKDWKIEADKMGSVYRNASLTIVAAAATSSDSGCFPRNQGSDASKVHRTQCELGVYNVQQDCGQHAQHALKLVATETAARLHSRSDEDGFRRRGPLDTRGWVLQEEILSARSLIFGEDGIYWECVSTLAADRKPEGVSWRHTAVARHSSRDRQFIDASYSRHFKGLLLELEDIYTASYEDGQSSFYRPTLVDTWMSIVENYSTRHLSFETDRLPALKGLTQVLKDMVDISGGIADGTWGLWDVKHLMWQVVDREQIRIEPCECVRKEDRRVVVAVSQKPRRGRKEHSLSDLPSWSWASVNQKVFYQSKFKGKPFATYEEEIFITSITSAASNRQLAIKGVMKPVLVFANTLSTDTMGGASIVHPKRACQSDKDYFYPDEVDWAAKQYMCLPVQAVYRKDSPDPVMLCLILDSSEDCHRRVGLATLGSSWKEYFELDKEARTRNKITVVLC